jgi:hypothetical protein
MSDQCVEQIFGTFRYRQCSRKAVKDGFCKQHHPDAVKARSDAGEARWKAQRHNSTFARLDRANKRIDELEAYIEDCRCDVCGAMMPKQKSPSPKKGA